MLIIEDVKAFNNSRVYDRKWEYLEFSTDEVCSICEKSSSAYINIPIVWEKDDKLLVCKTCLCRCDEVVNKCILDFGDD